MTKEGAIFKKVRLFKVSRELNLSLETVVDHLKSKGYAGAIEGAGPNASIVDEDAYYSLLEAFAADKAAASRLKEKRAQMEVEAAETVLPPVEEPPTPVMEDMVSHVTETQQAEPTVEPPAEEPPAAPALPEPEAAPETFGSDGADAPAAEALPTPDETPAPEAAAPEAAPALAPEAVAAAPETPEAPPEPQPAAETPEAAAPDAPAPDAPVAETPPEAQTPAPETAPEAAMADAVAAPEAAVTDAVASETTLEAPTEEEVLTADRYKLAGTKVVGKIDLNTLDDSAAKKKKRKRKRKGDETDKPAAEEAPRPAVVRPAAPSAADAAGKKKKRKRGPSVDEADVQATMSETLRELEQGVGRTRQRRRKQRRDERAAVREREREHEREQEQVLRVTEFISTGELANLLGVSVTEIISTLFKSGLMVSINQRLDADTISFVADEFGHEVEFITDFEEEDLVDEQDAPEDLEHRAPIVTVMGHVDHGKTSLLDHIRRANVVAGEAGGITQHIGAYRVALPDGRQITFLDTPGHEAFTAMRARGAQVTDIVILVVAADDAVMPQTIEAINHARAAEVPIVVAINKVDKPSANTQRVMQQLADQNVLVEQYGGKVQCSLVSAKAGSGVDELLEKVLLEAEIKELTGNPSRMASGVVIESRLEKGRGNVATVLVQNGTLRVGDTFIAGIYAGRVRAMFDERDKRIDEVGPGQPAMVLGFGGAPEVGDKLVVLKDEREAREIAQRRQQIHREQTLRQRKHITLDEIGRRLALGDFRELNLIIKADVGGSVEAMADALLKLSTAEVAVNIIHSGVGAITESDVMLASASDAIIIGFQVRPIPSARALAEREEIDIRLYSIIYKAIEDVHDALEGLLSPEESERIIGTAEVRNTFRVPKAGTVAGCYIIEGRIHRNDRVRLIRDGVVIFSGHISSLKRFKDDVREVAGGYECGISIENFNDIKVSDQIESFEIVETKRKLEVSPR